MNEPTWLNKEDALGIHELMLAQYGGIGGIRDNSLLEPALAKPQNLFVYGSRSISCMAASYAYRIVENHPFLDGNKRTGFMLSATFLELNGFRLTASEESVVAATFGLAAGEVSEDQYGSWLTDESITPGE